MDGAQLAGKRSACCRAIVVVMVSIRGIGSSAYPSPARHRTS